MILCLVEIFVASPIAFIGSHQMAKQLTDGGALANDRALRVSCLMSSDCYPTVVKGASEHALPRSLQFTCWLRPNR